MATTLDDTAGPVQSTGARSHRGSSQRWSWRWPLLTLLVLSGLFRVFDLDRAIIRDIAAPNRPRFLTGEASPWKQLYRYGEIPGMTIAVLGLALLVMEIACRRWNSQARIGLFLFMACCLGPGLLVNGILKSQCGRPRPREVQEFGGREQFHALGEFGHWRTNGSFPSGHAAIAFYLFAPAFLRCRWRWWTPAWLTAGLVFGGCVGLARVLQGAHFPSDVMWSLGIVYFVTLLTARLLQVQQVDVCDLWSAAPEAPLIPASQVRQAA